jgi:hypothetical protein
MTDGHQSMSPILLTGFRLEIGTALGVNAIDDLAHRLFVVLVEVYPALLQDVQHAAPGLGAGAVG